MEESGLSLSSKIEVKKIKQLIKKKDYEECDLLLNQINIRYKTVKAVKLSEIIAIIYSMVKIFKNCESAISNKKDKEGTYSETLIIRNCLRELLLNINQNIYPKHDIGKLISYTENFINKRPHTAIEPVTVFESAGSDP